MVDLRVHGTLLLVNEYLALVKLCHVLGGLYIWEFVTTLDYEWSIIRRRRPYRWTIWIYSFTRVTTLMTVIVILTGFDTSIPVNCQAWVTSTFVFGYLTLSTSMLLIAIRTVAIWNRNKVVIALATIGWVAHLAFIMQGISRLRSTWLGGPITCMLPNMESAKLAVVVTYVVDIVLVLTMLLGLYRICDQGGGGMLDLGYLLWKQGIIWLLFTTGTGLTTVVLVFLDLNAVLNLISLMPALVSLSIIATRIYASLTDFGSTDVVGNSDLERGPHPVSNVKRLPVVHVAHEPRPMPQSATLSLHMNEQACDEAHDLSLDDDLESGLEK